MARQYVPLEAHLAVFQAESQLCLVRDDFLFEFFFQCLDTVKQLVDF